MVAPTGGYASVAQLMRSRIRFMKECLAGKDPEDDVKQLSSELNAKLKQSADQLAAELMRRQRERVAPREESVTEIEAKDIFSADKWQIQNLNAQCTEKHKVISTLQQKLHKGET